MGKGLTGNLRHVSWHHRKSCEPSPCPIGGVFPGRFDVVAIVMTPHEFLHMPKGTIFCYGDTLKSLSGLMMLDKCFPEVGNITENDIVFYASDLGDVQERDSNERWANGERPLRVTCPETSSSKRSPWDCGIPTTLFVVLEKADWDRVTANAVFPDSAPQA